MALEREHATYLACKPDLLDREGQYIVIQGDYVLGVYPTFDDALTAGYGAFGLGSFMVQQIHAAEPVHTLGSGVTLPST